jgi:hypothetical protein
VRDFRSAFLFILALSIVASVLVAATTSPTSAFGRQCRYLRLNADSTAASPFSATRARVRLCWTPQPKKKTLTRIFRFVNDGFPSAFAYA